MPSVEQLQQALAEAKAVIADMEEFIDRVKNSALTLATIVVVEGDTVLVSARDGVKKVIPMPKTKHKAGELVWMHMQTYQIISKASTVPQVGELAIFKRYLTGLRAEVDVDNKTTTVYLGGAKEIKQGDTVVLDSSSTVIVDVIPREKIEIRTQSNTVTFDQIAGLHDAKRELLDAIVMPHKHPEIYKFYKKKPPKGILLSGPPGCGKTMLAKAAANALREVCDAKGSSDGFMYVKGPEILHHFVGASEAKIREIFAKAREYAREAGHPALLFIDEADAILGMRGKGISSDMEKTIVPMFLAEMDGLDETGAIVLLATNRPDTLDPAVVRDGRIDRKIIVPRPTPEAVSDIFTMHLVPLPTQGEMTHAEMAVHATAELFNPKRVMFRVKTSDNKMHDFKLQHIVNGALVATIVDQASSQAMHRDLAANTNTGVTLQDLYDSIDKAQKQNLQLNNVDAIDDFLTAHGGGAEFVSVHSA